jgi:hypothetical protein
MSAPLGSGPDPQPPEAGAPPASAYDGDGLLALLALLPVLYLGLDALAYGMRLPTDPSLLLASLATLVIAGVLALRDADVVRRRGREPVAAAWVLLSPAAYVVARTVRTGSSRLWPVLAVLLTALAFVRPFTGTVTPVSADDLEGSIEADIEQEMRNVDALVRCSVVPGNPTAGETSSCVVKGALDRPVVVVVVYDGEGGFTWAMS